jgi:hypothetical protein
MGCDTWWQVVLEVLGVIMIALVVYSFFSARRKDSPK